MSNHLSSILAPIKYHMVFLPMLFFVVLFLRNAEKYTAQEKKTIIWYTVSSFILLGIGLSLWRMDYTLPPSSILGEEILDVLGIILTYGLQFMIFLLPAAIKVKTVALLSYGLSVLLMIISMAVALIRKENRAVRNHVLSILCALCISFTILVTCIWFT